MAKYVFKRAVAIHVYGMLFFFVCHLFNLSTSYASLPLNSDTRLTSCLSTDHFVVFKKVLVKLKEIKKIPYFGI